MITDLALSWTDRDRYRRRYAHARSPYGPTDDGLIRWLREIHCASLAQHSFTLPREPDKEEEIHAV